MPRPRFRPNRNGKPAPVYVSGQRPPAAFGTSQDLLGAFPIDPPIISVVMPVTNPPSFNVLIPVSPDPLPVAVGDIVQLRIDGTTIYSSSPLTPTDISNGTITIANGTLTAGVHNADARIERPGTPNLFSNWSNVVNYTISTSVPANTVAPVISGGTPAGSLLTSTTGTWTNAPTGYTYQWQRAGVNISAATANTYTTVSADVGHAITSVVTASNGVGPSSPATSNSITVTVPAIAWNPTPVSGTATFATSNREIDGTSATYVIISNKASTLSGKVLVSAVMTTGTYHGFGLTHNSTPADTDLWISPTGLMWQRVDSVLINGADNVSGVTNGYVLAGEREGIALDITASRAWFTKNGTDWFGDHAAGTLTTADVAAGTGGLNISALTGPGGLYLFMCATFASGVGSASTMDASWPFAAPSGFTYLDAN